MQKFQCTFSDASVQLLFAGPAQNLPHRRLDCLFSWCNQKVNRDLFHTSFTQCCNAVSTFPDACNSTVCCINPKCCSCLRTLYTWIRQRVCRPEGELTAERVVFAETRGPHIGLALPVALVELRHADVEPDEKACDCGVHGPARPRRHALLQTVHHSCQRQRSVFILWTVVTPKCNVI